MKSFTFEVTVDEDDKLAFKSKNDGFNGFELIGFLRWKLDDVEKQMYGQVKPDIVKRTLVRDAEGKTK